MNDLCLCLSLASAFFPDRWGVNSDGFILPNVVFPTVW